MNDPRIDPLFETTPPPPDPALLARIERSMRETLVPVRPLPSGPKLVTALIGISGIISVAGAALLGWEGIRRLNAERIALIFPVLILLTILAATFTVAQTIPGSKLLVNPLALLAGSILALSAIFAILFRDDDMSRFVPQGLVCLGVGLFIAIPTAMLAWGFLRRGFAVDPVLAGLAAGTFAGLTGLIMLELHCPNFRTMHLLVWHTAVIPVTAFAGALLGGFLRRK